MFSFTMGKIRLKANDWPRPCNEKVAELGLKVGEIDKHLLH